MVEVAVTKIQDKDLASLKSLEFDQDSVIRFTSFLSHMLGDDHCVIASYDENGEHIGSFSFDNSFLFDDENTLDQIYEG